MGMVIGQGTGIGHQFHTLFHFAQKAPSLNIKRTTLGPNQFKGRTQGLDQMQGFLSHRDLNPLGDKKPMIARRA